MPVVTFRSPRWWVLPVIVIVVMVTALGGFVAHDAYRRPAAATSSPPVSTSMSSDGASIAAGLIPVRLSRDAASYPLSSAAASVVQRFFDAINNKRYDEWRSIATAARIARQPLAQWLDAYGSTQDSEIDIYRIDPAPEDSLRVLLGFVSHQSADKAPKGFPFTCIRWHVVFPLTLVRGEWKLDADPSSKTPQQEKC